MKEAKFLFSCNTHEGTVHLRGTHKNVELVTVIGPLDSMERQKGAYAVNSMSSVSVCIRESSLFMDYCWCEAKFDTGDTF